MNKKKRNEERVFLRLSSKKNVIYGLNFCVVHQPNDIALFLLMKIKRKFWNDVRIFARPRSPLYPLFLSLFLISSKAILVHNDVFVSNAMFRYLCYFRQYNSASMLENFASLFTLLCYKTEDAGMLHILLLLLLLFFCLFSFSCCLLQRKI